MQALVQIHTYSSFAEVIQSIVEVRKAQATTETNPNPDPNRNPNICYWKSLVPPCEILCNFILESEYTALSLLTDYFNMAIVLTNEVVIEQNIAVLVL